MGTDVLFTRFFTAARLALLATATALAIAATGASAQQTAPAQAQVTFTKDVAPILYRSCIRCHRPDEIAPMSLLTYNDARPWARAIRTWVSSWQATTANRPRNIQASSSAGMKNATPGTGFAYSNE